MATTLYLRNTSATGVVPNAQQGSGKPGWDFYESDVAGTITALAMNQRPGVGKQTIGGTARAETKNTTYMHWMKCWISPPVAYNITLAGTFTLVLNQYEGTAQHNTYPRVIIYIWKADDTKGLDLFAEASSATECGTDSNANTTFWSTTNLTSRSLSTGDRIAIEVMSHCNQPSTTGDKTVTIGYDAATGAAGCSYLQLSQNVTFQPYKLSTEGIRVTDRLKKRFKKKLTRESIKVTDRLIKRFKKKPKEGFTATDTVKTTKPLSPVKLNEGFFGTDRLVKRFRKPLSDGFDANDAVRKLCRFVLDQGFDVTASSLKRFSRATKEGFYATASGRKSVKKEISEGFDTTDVLRKSARKTFSEAFDITDETRKIFSRAISEGFYALETVAANIPSAGDIKLTEGLRVVAALVEKTIFKKFNEGFKFDAVKSTTGMVKKLVEELRADANRAMSDALTFRESINVGDKLTKIIHLVFVSKILISHGIGGAKIIDIPQAIRIGVSAVSKHFKKTVREGLYVTGDVSASTGNIIAKALEEGFLLVPFINKTFDMVRSDGVAVEDRLLKRGKLVLSETFELTDETLKNLSRVISSGVTITDELAHSAIFERSYAEGLYVTDSLLKGLTKALRAEMTVVEEVTTDFPNRITKVITEGIQVVSNLVKRVSYHRLIIQPINVMDEATATGPSEIEGITPWLGSFPKPATAASLTMQVTDELYNPVSDLAVTAYIYSASTGLLWKTLTLSESSITAGIYRGYFSIGRRDPTGTYPVHVHAQKGFWSSTEYDGFLTVYVGTPSGISYH